MIKHDWRPLGQAAAKFIDAANWLFSQSGHQAGLAAGLLFAIAVAEWELRHELRRLLLHSQIKEGLEKLSDDEDQDGQDLPEAVLAAATAIRLASLMRMVMEGEEITPYLSEFQVRLMVLESLAERLAAAQ